MTVYYLRDKNPIWTQTIERMIGRLSDLTVDRGDFAYIPLGGFEPNARFGPQAKMPTGTEAVEYGNIRLIQGLEQYYKVTGYEPARSLAAKLVRYAMGPAESYDSQGGSFSTLRIRKVCARDSRESRMKVRRPYPFADTRPALHPGTRHGGE